MMNNMREFKAIKGTKMIETIENYSIAENDTHSSFQNIESKYDSIFYTDKDFWDTRLRYPKEFGDKTVGLYNFVISEWVARVPGLYWADSSASIRQHTEDEIAVKSKEWTEYTPPGKSKKVLGGIGTILLPVDDMGKRIVSASSSCNSSLGVPLLIFPDVWEYLKLCQGDIVIIKNAKWQSVDLTWSHRFASTRNIPRGYLVIDKIDKIEIIERDYPIVDNPFSIMEYQKGDALLYDFVYLTIDSKVNNAKQETEEFFSNYAKKDSRNGRYLINPNMVDPIFDAKYMTPSEMHLPTQKAQIELLYERIKNENFDKITLNELIELLPKYYDSTSSIRRLVKNLGVSVSIIQEDSPASMSAQLINFCLRSNKIEELVDRMMVEYPKIFK